jgi:TldD protein
MGLVAIAAENGTIETSFEGPGAQAGFEYFTKKIDYKEKALEVAKTAILMLHAAECPSGKMPVVIGNVSAGSSSTKPAAIRLKRRGRQETVDLHRQARQQIANPIVTAIDDGTIPNGWGTGNIDDEGNPTQKNVLIKNGILKSYLIDDFNGRRMGAKGNGATRRQNYKYEPTSRMSNTYIDNGKSTPEEIIAATKFGLYANRWAGVPSIRPPAISISRCRKPT